MTDPQPLSDDLLRRMDAWWRAANYLNIGQIYLMENPLLRQPLRVEHITPRLLGPAEQFELLTYGIGVTNAAARTTPGSGDLRKGDFAGAKERLESIASDLNPAWIGFVGKEAYRGSFGERPELGAQERRLANTRLFVLPSTSPANAAVPWEERLRWFEELSRASGL